MTETIFCLILKKVLDDVLQERFRERFAEDPELENSPFSWKDAKDRTLIRVTASIISVFKSRPLSHPVIESFVEITSGVRLAFRRGGAASRASLLQPAGYLRWIIILLVCEGRASAKMKMLSFAGRLIAANQLRGRRFSSTML